MVEWLRITLLVAICFFLLAGARTGRLAGIFSFWFWLTIFT